MPGHVPKVGCVHRFLLDAEIEMVSANLKSLVKELPVSMLALIYRKRIAASQRSVALTWIPTASHLHFSIVLKEMMGTLQLICSTWAWPQDEEGKPREVTSDDYACLQFKLVPRASVLLGPSWASEDGHISAHATLTTRGRARVDNQIIVSGSKGAVIVGTSNGGLRVTDEAGRVGLKIYESRYILNPDIAQGQ